MTIIVCRAANHRPWRPAADTWGRLVRGYQETGSWALIMKRPGLLSSGGGLSPHPTGHWSMGLRDIAELRPCTRLS